MSAFNEHGDDLTPSEAEYQGYGPEAQAIDGTMVGPLPRPAAGRPTMRAVPREGEEPSVVTAASITAALERFKAAQAAPLEHYDPDLGGFFRYRLLTGQEVRDCGKLAMAKPGTPQAHLDSDQFEFLLVNRASVEPRVTTAMWAELLQLWPMVPGRLSQAIRKANGMEDDAIEEAGKPSTETPS